MKEVQITAYKSDLLGGRVFKTKGGLTNAENKFKKKNERILKAAMDRAKEEEAKNFIRLNCADIHDLPKMLNEFSETHGFAYTNVRIADIKGAKDGWTHVDKIPIDPSSSSEDIVIFKLFWDRHKERDKIWCNPDLDRCLSHKIAGLHGRMGTSGGNGTNQIHKCYIFVDDFPLIKEEFYKAKKQFKQAREYTIKNRARLSEITNKVAELKGKDINVFVLQEQIAKLNKQLNANYNRISQEAQAMIPKIAAPMVDQALIDKYFKR